MVPSPENRTIRVSPGGSAASPAYDVTIGPGVLNSLGSILRRLVPSEARALVVHDSGVPERFTAATVDSLRSAGLEAIASSWSASESAKTLHGVEELLSRLARERFDRRGVVVALGGGVTGDVAGFAAGVYQRGIAWVACPATLLAMVDSAVGGKTGVNLALPGGDALKNMVGVVHHPLAVVADTELLRSLPPRAFHSGLAECVKHAMIGADWGDPELMDWTKANLSKVQDREPAPLVELIARSVSLKATVVAADGRETSDAPGGGRMALNFGHTFGHAIEPLAGLSWSDHSGLEHGEAVGLGLIAAARCAQRMNLVSPEIGDEAEDLLRRCGLPTRVHGLPDNATLIARMRHDKKARGGTLRLVLPVARGRVRVVAEPPIEAVAAGLTAIRA